MRCSTCMGDHDAVAVGRAACRPACYNSAYFEHSFLAQQMGIDLVEGRDLVVSDGFVYMRTTKGFERIDVLYRRIDDDFLDPQGVPRGFDARRAGADGGLPAGRIALANAPGTGIADDKVVYAYVPQIIKYYLGEDAIIPNVPTYVCWDDTQRQHVLANLDKLVVKPANESGGYGLMIGPRASAEERAKCARADSRQSAQLHRPADAQPVARAGADRRRPRRPARRPAAVHRVRPRDVRAARRSDARGAEEGLAGGEFVARRRQQRYLGAFVKSW